MGEGVGTGESDMDSVAVTPARPLCVLKALQHGEERIDARVALLAADPLTLALTSALTLAPPLR